MKTSTVSADLGGEEMGVLHIILFIVWWHLSNFALWWPLSSIAGKPKPYREALLPD